MTTSELSQPNLVVLRVTMLAAGAIAIAVGLLHFFMPSQYRNSNGLAGLANTEDDFVVLITFAVGILLIAFGAVTLMFARRPERNSDLTYYYLLISVMLWAGRFTLELLYPVRLRMFGIEPFTVIVTPGIAAVLALLVVAAVQAGRLHRSRT